MRFNTPGLFAVGGLVIFVMGGLTGVMVAMVPFDWQAHDSYFIVAHLHYVLIGGMVFPLFAAIYYWTPMSSSRPLSERWGKWIFWLMFVGHNVTFMPMHLTGLMGMPRRVHTYLPDRGWDLPNMISTVGSFMFGLAVVLWMIDMIRNFRPFGEKDAGNVFGGPGLEWLPAGRYSLRSVPVIKSLYPVWDQPNLARDVEAGRYFLPGAPRGERETMITSPINAEPQYLQRMPRPSSWYVWGAIFTAGFFLILTIQAYVASLVSGVLAVYCILKWCWGLDRPGGPATVDVGGGVRLPTYVSGPSSHGWWAMVITLIVSGMVAIMACFSYVFLWSRRPDLWQAPPEIGSLPLTLGLLAAAGIGAWASQGALKLDRPRSAAIASVLMLVATVAAGGAFASEASAWWNSGLRPDASSQGATVYALLAWQGTFVGISLLMGPFVLLRWLCGLVSSRYPATFEVVALFVAFTAVQGAATTLLIRLFPGVGA